MRKIILLEVLVSTLLLTGCQNNKNKTPEKKDEYTKNLKFELLEDDTYGVRIGRAYFEKSISIQPYFEDKPVTKILEEFGYIGEYDPNTFDEDCEDNKYAICEKILLPNTITTLDYDAFYYCKNLLAVYIPKSVTEFNDYWKCNSENCHYYFEADEVSDDIIDAERYEGYVEFGVTAEEFKNIDLDTLKPKTVETEIMINGVPAEVTFTKNEDGNGTLNGIDCNAANIEIPKYINDIKIVELEEQCFYGLDNMVSLYVPETIEKIQPASFRYNVNLATIVVDPNNKFYDSRNECNAIIEKSTGNLVLGCKNTIIPEGVTSIEQEAFNEAAYLISLSIPEGVVSIGESAFWNCYGLTHVYFPNTLTRIETNAFFSCSSLVDIFIPKSVLYIGELAFSSLSSSCKIYCEAEEQPEGWSEEWYDSSAEVNWGATR